VLEFVLAAAFETAKNKNYYEKILFLDAATFFDADTFLDAATFLLFGFLDEGLLFFLSP
jgi:hypothetical protein